jgi:hypothetical protein
MSIKKDHRFMTGTHPVVSEEEEQRVSRPSEAEILRWRRMGALRGALIYIVSPILLASAIGALAYITRPEAMPAHERMREMAREVQARRLREAHQGVRGASAAAAPDAGTPLAGSGAAPPLPEPSP